MWHQNPPAVSDTRASPALQRRCHHMLSPTCLSIDLPRRDIECAATVEHMYDQADVPERVYVGVCEQNFEQPGGSEDCTTGERRIRLT